MPVRLPKGDDFLPDISMDHLREMYRREADADTADRLKACIFRKNGHSIQTISEGVGRTYGTVYGWLRRAENESYDIGDGPVVRLDGMQLEELRGDLIAGPVAHGFEFDLWSVETMSEHIRRKYKVHPTSRTVWGLMREMGFVSTGS